MWVAVMAYYEWTKCPVVHRDSDSKPVWVISHLSHTHSPSPPSLSYQINCILLTSIKLYHFICTKYKDYVLYIYDIQTGFQKSLGPCE